MRRGSNVGRSQSQKWDPGYQTFFAVPFTGRAMHDGLTKLMFQFEMGNLVDLKYRAVAANLRHAWNYARPRTIYENDRTISIWTDGIQPESTNRGKEEDIEMWTARMRCSTNVILTGRLRRWTDRCSKHGQWRTKKTESVYVKVSN